MSICNTTKRITVSLWLVVLLWLVLIFALSAQPATQSNGFSEKVTETIIRTIAWIVHIDLDAKTINGLVIQMNHFVRKFAHAWIYSVLGILVIRSFIYTGIKGFKAYMFALLFCFFYAGIDEIHQTVVSGRSGQISDVLLDTTGAVFGMGLYWVYSRVRRFASAN